MANGLFYYKLVSEYPEDVTKNCKLTITEIDSNFKTLKDVDIKTAEFVRGEDCETNSGDTLVITRNNGEKIIVPMNTELCKNLTYDLKTDVTECKSGATLTITYKDDEGEHTTTLENVITADNLVDVIGHDILTKVISDDTLIGLGTMRSPLGLAGIEKTGMLAPAIDVLDFTESGGKLPKYGEKGERHVTREYVSDYGYLYNGNGVKKIQDLLDKLYEDNEVDKEVSDRNYYWRVPSKADWDKMLDSIEPCRYRNHTSTDCHKELGKLAGKFLKSNCGCKGEVEYPQAECTCISSKSYGDCTYNGDGSQNQPIDADDYIFDNTDDIPNDKFIDPTGIDRYGMKILPAGVMTYRVDRPTPSGFGTMSAFWTTTHIYNDPGQDIYIKVFDCDKSGVYQVAECPEPYYAVRLVKDYDGSNFHQTEYIDGVVYKCVLFPESGQIWLASNFANTVGFIGYNEVNNDYPTPDYLLPNNGDDIKDRRIEMFINEFNGRYWEKKVMEEGTTIVIQNPSEEKVRDFIYEWTDEDGEDYEVDVEILGNIVTYSWNDQESYTIELKLNEQDDLEYRVYIDDECEKYLRNTDDLVVERVLNMLIPLLEKERQDREAADLVLSGAIVTEREERISADTALSGAVDFVSGAVDDLRADLEEEISARTEADKVLSGAIDDLRAGLSAETEARIAADEVLSGAIDTLREDLDNEIARAISAETEISGLTIDTSEDYTLEVSKEEGYNLVLKSKDGNPDHFVNIKFDGNFGEI